MRTKNARAIDQHESEHLAAVKSCACVITNAPPPSEAHHLKQGLHYTAVALSKEAHTGPRGIHGDKSLWKVAHMTELDALNETLRRVALLRAGKTMPVTAQKVRNRGGDLSSSKILPRRAA